MKSKKKQFCRNGHDTYELGRASNGQCRKCKKDSVDRWRSIPENKEKYREARRAKYIACMSGEIVNIKTNRNVITITGTTEELLRKECKRRGYKSTDTIVKRIIEVVAKDNLFSAVLDG